MLTTINFISKTLLLTLFTLSLVTCGGGGGTTSTTIDTKMPEILSTSPKPGQANVALDASIKITFDENISTVTTDQVSIYTFVNEAFDVKNPIVLNNTDSFDFNVKTKVLEVRLKPGDLISNSRYRVTIQSIKDPNGNSISTCQWQFTTIEAAVLITDNKLLCGLDWVQPGAIRKLTAVAGNGRVTLNWLAATSGGAISYYKIARRPTDVSSFFTSVNSRLSGTMLSFTDSKVQNGQSYSYRVIAVNSSGDESKKVFSPRVTPKATDIPGMPQNVSASAGNAQVLVNWQAPITGGAVDNYNVSRTSDNITFDVLSQNLPNTTLTYSDIIAQYNVKYTYLINAGNSAGKSSSASSNAVILRENINLIPILPSSFLNSQNFAQTNYFGNALSFSPDATTLAISDSYGNSPGKQDNAGTLQLFNHINSGWQPIQILSSPKPTSSSFYAKSVSFSPDGKMLAVGDLGAKLVYIYSKKQNIWTLAQTINPTDRTGAGEFGFCVSFSPDSLTLAVCDPSATFSKMPGAGAVYLFNTNTWKETQRLEAATPVAMNKFGGNVSFSPDSTTLAIGLKFYVSTSFAGLVHTFTNTANTWVNTQILESKLSDKKNQFGAFPYQIAFSPDSQTIAIGESGLEEGSNVQLFTRSGNNWIPGAVLLSQNPVTFGAFGNSVSFSLDGKILAVGQAVTGDIQLFKYSRTTTGWSYSELLSIAPNGGHSIAFSTDGTLAVGNIFGTVQGVLNAGNVAIFNPGILP